MTSFVDYIANPAVIIEAVVFIFTLGVTWSNLNNKIANLERRVQKLEELDLDSRLTRMETTLEYIRTTLEKLEKLHN
jgi:fumarate reductase subunit C